MNTKYSKEHGGANKGKLPLELIELTGFTLQGAANAGLWKAVAAGLELAQNSVQFSRSKLTMSSVQAFDLGTANGVANITS